MMKELLEYLKNTALTFIEVGAKAQSSIFCALFALMMLGTMNVSAEEISLNVIPFWEHEAGLWSFDAPKNTQTTPEWVIGEPASMPYGDVMVNNWADLSTFDKLVITYSEGNPRILLNRDQDEGQWAENEAESHLIDNTRGGWSSKYFNDENGILTVNIKQIVKDKGYAHLHAIKSVDWEGKITVNSIMLERDNTGWDEQLVNGSFVGSDVSCFMCREENGEVKSARLVSVKGYRRTRCIQINSMDNSTESWYTQFFIHTPNYVWKPGQRFRLSFKACADKPAHINSQGHAAPGDYLSWMTFGEYQVTTEWKQYDYEGEIPNDIEGLQTIALDLNVLPEANTYYFDDISWSSVGTTSSEITVTAKSYTINYGDAIPTLEYTTSGSTLSGKPTLSCNTGSAGSRPNAGVYDITISKGTVSNSNVKFVNGTLTVKKATLTVSVGDYTKTEGEDMPQFVISYSGFKKSDTKNSLTKQPVATCEANKWSPAGSYPIIVSGGESPNYNFSYKNGTLTIGRVYSMTIMSQGNGSVKYGSNNVTNYQRFDVNVGSSVTLTFIPDNGYILDQLTVNGEDVTKEVKNNAYNLGLLTKDVIVIANFVESTGTIRIGGITYSILSAPEKTVVVGKSTTYRGHVKIPETITRSGEEWRVVGVASNAFNNCSSLISITLPQSMKSENMGLSLFTGCTKLAAIVWNANFMLTTSVMGTVNNPNLLFYTKSISYSPRGVDNVIVDGSADKITLQDGGPDGDNFYCPIAFTANSISYTHSYAMESAYGGVGGWETLALPFTVQQIKHERVGDIIPFAAYDSSMERRPFWLYTYSGSGFVRAASIEANVPYIICMPNNSEYDAEFLLGGKVTFSAQNATVASSDGTAQKEQPSRNNKTFVAAYKAKTRAISTDVYAMNVVNERYSETGGYTAGSIFINNLRTVAPFEAVMTTSSVASRVISIDFNETTSIESLPAVNSNIYNVYNLNGQLLIQTDNIEELNRQVNQLPAGVYVVNGKKMIINK